MGKTISLYFFMKNTDNTSNINIKPVEPLLKAQADINRDLEKQVYGSANEVQRDRERTNARVNDVVADLIQKETSSANGDLIGGLESYYGNSGGKEKETFNRIKEALSNPDGASDIYKIYSELNSTISKTEDLNVVVNLIPQLGDAINAITDSILSPDDFTKQVVLSLMKADVELKEDDEFRKEAMQVLHEYKYNKHIKEIVGKTAIQGKHYVAAIPYSRAFQYLMNDKDMRLAKQNLMGKTLSESFKGTTEKPESLLTESFTSSLSECFETKGVNNIRNSLIDTAESFVLQEGAVNLVDMDVLQEAKKNNMIKRKKKKDEAQTLADELAANGKITNDGFKTPDEIQQLTDADTASLKGVVIKHLDIRKVIPLEVDDICLGYYYIESDDTQQALRKSYNPQQWAQNIKKSASKQTVSNSVENAYDNLSKLLLHRLDKKFLEKNAHIKDEIYGLLKYHQVLHNRNAVKVTYLRPDEVHKFELNNGKSVLENVLFFAKLYLGLLMSNIMMRISRSNDIRAYYINSGVAPDVSSVVNHAINEIKKDNRSLMHLNNIPRMIATTTKFTDLFLPTDKDGKRPIDFDIIQGQDVQVKDEMMEMLEEIIVSGTGVPSVLLNASNDVDFAKTLTMLSTKYLRRVLGWQLELNEPNTDFIRAILHSELDDRESEINSLTTSFQAPTNLVLQNALDEINNARDLANAISGAMIGDNNQDEDAQRLLDILNLEIMKQYAPSVPWANFNALLEQAKIKLQKEKEDKKAKEKGDSGGDDTSGY